jgi:hypothetical protein
MSGGNGGNGRNGGNGKDLQVDGLDLIAQGITNTLSELEQLGLTGWAGAGRGFSELKLSGLELGHDDLTSAFASFCERWEWGVRALVEEGNGFAQAVGLSAGTFHETEQYIEGSFKVLANSLIGNPYATEDEVTKTSWGGLVDGNAFAHPDYSAQSFRHAADVGEQSLEQAKQDFLSARFVGGLPGPQLARDALDAYAEARYSDEQGEDAR